MAVTPARFQLIENEIVDVDVLKSSGIMLESFTDESNPAELWRQLRTNPWFAVRYYDELEDKDDASSGALEVRRKAVLCRPRSIVAASDDPRDREIAERATEMLGAIPNLRTVKEEILDAVPKGVSIAEIIPERRDGLVMVRAIRAKPAVLFEFGRMNEPQVGYLRLREIYRTRVTESVNWEAIQWKFRGHVSTPMGQSLGIPPASTRLLALMARAKWDQILGKIH